MDVLVFLLQKVLLMLWQLLTFVCGVVWAVLIHFHTQENVHCGEQSSFQGKISEILTFREPRGAGRHLGFEFRTYEFHLMLPPGRVRTEIDSYKTITKIDEIPESVPCKKVKKSSKSGKKASKTKLSSKPGSIPGPSSSSILVPLSPKNTLDMSDSESGSHTEAAVEVSLEELTLEAETLAKTLLIESEKAKIRELKAKIEEAKVAGCPKIVTVPPPSASVTPPSPTVMENLAKLAKGTSASCSDLSGKASAHDLDELAKFKELNRAVEEKMRAFGAGGLSLSCPGLDHVDMTDPGLFDPTAAAYLGKSLRKSGREAKVSDNVLRSVKWPHAALSYKTATAYENLDFPLLVAGELAIIASKGTPEAERQGRTELLQSVALNARIYQWQAVRDYHGTVLLEIERGVRDWGPKESYRDVEPDTLYGFRKDLAFKSKPKIPGFGESAPKVSGLARRYYCFPYQSGTCPLPSKHEGTFGPSSAPVVLEHYCSACFRKTRSYMPHPSSDPSCPSKF